MGSRYKLYSEIQLTELIIQQDTYAFEELYNRYWSVLYAFSMRILNDEKEAEDAVQESFITLYQKSSALDPTSPASSYLFRIVRNALLNIRKHEKIKARVLATFVEHYEKGVAYTDEMVIEKELASLIEIEIENMPPAMRAIFELSRGQYLKRKQIAERLNVSEMTVKTQLQRALSRIRSRISCVFWLSLMQFMLWLSRSF